MKAKRKLDTPCQSEKSTRVKLVTPPKTRRNKFVDDGKYKVQPHSPGFDKSTPCGNAFPQSRGPYCPPNEVPNKKSYHKQRLAKVPLKRKRGRKKKLREAMQYSAPAMEFDIKACGYVLGRQETYGIFSSHKKFSFGCECLEFLRALKDASETWHWYNWWRTARGEDRYQFLFHHCAFHIERQRQTERVRMPPCCLVNMRVPGIIKSYTICRVQFFHVVGVHSRNYGSIIRRIWHDKVELNLHTTHWKPRRAKTSKWFELWRVKFAEWHTLEEGHYSQSARKGLVGDRKAFHIVRESGFDKLYDYWEEFIRKTPELNPPNKVTTLDDMIQYSTWKRGNRAEPPPSKPSILKINQPFPSLSTFTSMLSSKLDMKRKAPISEQCAVCSSFDTWIYDADTSKDNKNLLLLKSEYQKHKAIYDWARSKIRQCKDTASESYKGILE